MNVIEFMKKASEAYYDGNPIISDEEYDALERTHGQIIAGSGDIPHRFRMYSLKKHYDKDGEPPLPSGDCIKTPKLDGAAVSLLYLNGKLSLALTRGDGIKGRDITEKVKKLPGVRQTIETDRSVLQVTGEVVVSKDIDNSRNFASGTLNLKEMEEFEERLSIIPIQFVAYGVQTETGHGIYDSYNRDMLYLSNQGISTILYPPIRGEIHDNVNIDFIPWEEMYPTDGMVFRLADNNKFNYVGFTDKFPRGAYAYKTEQESVVTTLLDVEWQTGKSGKVTPVAILETVEIDGANISKATLNNIAYIEALDLELGCKVKVIRSGEIIPKIIGRA